MCSLNFMVSLPIFSGQGWTESSYPLIYLDHSDEFRDLGQCYEAIDTQKAYSDHFLGAFFKTFCTFFFGKFGLSKNHGLI